MVQGLAIHLGPNEVQNECLEYMTVPQGAAGTLATSVLLLLFFLRHGHTHPGTPWPKSDLRITKIITHYHTAPRCSLHYHT